MNPEQTRHERFTSYAHLLSERFHSGMLSQLQPLNQWVVWKGKGELEAGKRKKSWKAPAASATRNPVMGACG